MTIRESVPRNEYHSQCDLQNLFWRTNAPSDQFLFKRSYLLMCNFESIWNLRMKNVFRQIGGWPFFKGWPLKVSGARWSTIQTMRRGRDLYQGFRFSIRSSSNVRYHWRFCIGSRRYFINNGWETFKHIQKTFIDVK